MRLFIKYRLTLIGAILGMAGGYLYYHFVGCQTGACAITSKPVNSSLYGALLGGLLFNAFSREEKDKNKMSI